MRDAMTSEKPWKDGGAIKLLTSKTVSFCDHGPQRWRGNRAGGGIGDDMYERVEEGLIIGYRTACKKRGEFSMH